MKQLATSTLLATIAASLLPSYAAGQSIAIFPDEYAAVPEGPYSSFSLPLANGTSRVMCLYDAVDLDIPVGNMITKIGFRQDGTSSGIDLGADLQLEVRMGWATNDHQSMHWNFDQNYATPPTTTFGPALFQLPSLRDPAAPLNNGLFFIPLSTPFAYTPNGRNLLVEYRILGTSNSGAGFTYRLDRATFYSPVIHGPAGCPHSGGLTPVQVLQPARIGAAWASACNDAPSNAPGFVAIHLGSSLVAPYPLAPIFPGISAACTGQMNPTGTYLFSGSANANGIAQASFQIPNDPQFVDMTLSSQWLFLDSLSPGQVVTSNGSEVSLGSNPRTTILSSNGAPSQQTAGSLSTNYCPVAVFEHQ